MNLRLALVFLTVCCLVTPPSWADGARLYKSSPIQITADGSEVWVAQQDNDSVARITTATDVVLEIPLPDSGQSHSPRGLSVTDDGSEVWVACHDSDRVYVLSGVDGTELARIDLPWGTGPYSIVLAPPEVGGQQTHALVSGYRGSTVVVLDVATRSVDKVLQGVWHSPLAISFAADGSAWVSHLFADGEHTRLSRVDLSDPNEPQVTTLVRVTAVIPQNASSTSPRLPDGGYVTPRGHLAQVPAGQDQGRLWVPSQYQNIHNDGPTPDATIQATIRKIDLSSRSLASGTNLVSNPQHPAKIILSAVDVHDPTQGGTAVYDGPGWDAQVSGPIDLAFSQDGTTAYVLFEQSEDLLVMPTSTPPVRPAGSSPLVEISVGKRPMGLVASPVSSLAWVLNTLSRDVSVVDLAAGTELRRIATNPVTGEPFGAARLRGAQIFHSSNEDTISLNRKVACASCHFNGEHDGRIWDFQHLPGNHGPRHTPTLLGLAASLGPLDPNTGWGQLHRSGDRDEVQDFEHTFQGVQMGGTGFLPGTVHPELGTPNAGRNADLDALAAYTFSLPTPARSPHRLADGTLSEAAVRGATFFLGTDPGHPADAACATCHLPTAGFSDQLFHDVGQAVRPGESELNNRVPANHVNTASLLGLWTTPPYTGVFTFAESLMASLLDFRTRPGARAPHGDLDTLTLRQMSDLQEFLLSLDGDLTGAEVLAAVDQVPPRVLRVSPTSLTQLEVWFDESLEQSSAQTLSTWQIRQLPSGTPVSVLGASLDLHNTDRVTLTVDPMGDGCNSQDLELVVVGPLLDRADSASGGMANALLNAPPVPFSLGSQLTITLGASGYENLTVPVHDAATIPGLSNWSHGGAWIFPNGNTTNTGFVRFEWETAFRTATGVTDAADLLEARISLQPTNGDAQTIEVRRVLQEWFDHRGHDFNNNPVDPATGRGGPTWRSSEHGARLWNSNNARATQPGVEGDDPADYFGSWDTAHTPDATLPMSSIIDRFEVSGPRVSDAFRFWFDNPSVDFGYALRVLPGGDLDTRFEGVEHELGGDGPVLTLTYNLVGSCSGLFADDFESGDTSAWSATFP
ncbi:MAG: hypothetical protein K0U98_03710 [Deltaproteobacteria bacterium]|nr:hypothetical protein [Deltaproteobacteria bacterium]